MKKFALHSLLSRIRGNHQKKIIDPQGFSYTVSMSVGSLENAERYARWHGRVLDASILANKSSETLFILGSGPSINRISEKMWARIGSNDSVGFNWWMAHDFVPTYYVLQFNGSPELVRLAHLRSAAYKQTPIILRGDYFSRGLAQLDRDQSYRFLMEHNLHYLVEYPISSQCSVPIENLVRHAELLGMLTHGRVGSPVPKWRCTLGLLLSLGFQMGYKRLVLCGMDMSSNDHFWDDPEFQHLYSGYNLPVCEHNRRSSRRGIMAFTDESVSPNTVPRYVEYLASWMNRSAGVEIYIQSEETLLHPSLPIYSF
jgi:hypothetical protein